VRHPRRNLSNGKIYQLRGSLAVGSRRNLTSRRLSYIAAAAHLAAVLRGVWRVQSRCAIIRFTRLSDADVLSRVMRVVEAEKV
jgi:hypothetical protein